MPWLFICLASWLLFWNPQTSISTTVTAPIVDLGYARYQGHHDPLTNVTSFLSVRYAAPPLGRLRFQAPQAPHPELGVQTATQNPNSCYQVTIGSRSLCPTTTMSEDCLFLNVFVPGTMSPKTVAADRLPVLVWIHGGAYIDGCAAAFNGADLVADSLNTVIVVVIQYRLGAFGFLPGNEVKARGALNIALLDQAFALRWVQDHIGLFGGDKTRVTIWGESAGAGSVLQHIVANGGNTQPPLFNAAIASSTLLFDQYYYNDPLPQALYSKLVKAAGCASNADTFGCLQSMDAVILAAANREVAHSPIGGHYNSCPVVDGTFILERPSVTLAKGRVNGQLLLAVYNENEGHLFVEVNKTSSITNYISYVFPSLTSLEVKEAASLYKDYGSIVEQATMLLQESTLLCPTYYMLKAFAGRSWKGLFAIPPAYHADDLPYYFHSPSDPPPYNNKAFITAFSQSFMSVVKYGDVNVKFESTDITPHWPMYSVGETEMLFNRTEAGAPVVTPIHTDPGLLRRCAFWSSVTSATAE